MRCERGDEEGTERASERGRKRRGQGASKGAGEGRTRRKPSDLASKLEWSKERRREGGEGRREGQKDVTWMKRKGRV
jgi:hypothetical protein